MKVLLVDDHPLILAALQAVIQGLGDDVSVFGVATADEARAALKRDAGFDLALMDLGLGDEDGFQLLAEVRADYPALPVVVVSATERQVDVIRAIDMGAMGFVPKRASNRDLFEALRMVMSGGVYIPPMMLGLAPPPPGGDTVPAVMRPTPPDQPLPAPEPAQKVRTLESLGLTPRQAEVLALLLKGMPNKLIARELSLSVETVKDHVAAVLRALGVSSRTQAVLAVSQMTQANPGLTAWRPTSQR
ncbi:MAG TPA: response regulator transcription factor [Burkholderiaceae bacterium]|nr:response regulator transcription factor [Burkholderiaceae bacterium]